MTRTYCENCEFMSSTNANAPSYRWLCLQHPRLEGSGFATRGLWDKDAPFLRCIDVNGGACPLFEPRKDTEDAAKS